MTKLEVYYQIAELKEIDYRNTLAIASMIEVLIEKGIIEKNDISKKARELENITTEEIVKNNTINKKVTKVHKIK
ncbi:hypothetical protein [Garciella nitratireducens]|uniref:Uncharacterized protein n=1 Tax=Garciella nitratireducens DSM 15102 TaxID=1121911 RepID=A0A1T4NL87_9FIRM|nr:hypothetical protein [Garciella nitratireducens]RBP38000.1 hypothetical protein DFR81_12126 [Garciella nitratireducens]SJZ80019.1 hypothetical protein SAMN02745973_01734 [Garciella nitratireducens DSM 15102]